MSIDKNFDGFYDKDNVIKHGKDKFKKSLEKLGSRSGPNVIWLKESEDDKKLRLPYSDFRDGIPTLSSALNDFEKGLAVIGGRSNTGKSTLITNMQVQSLTLNDDLMVLDYSLDDDYDKRVQQFLACLSGLTYQQITTKSDLTERQIESKNQAVQQFTEWIEKDRLRNYEAIETVVGVRGQLVDISYRRLVNIKNSITAARKIYPNRKIVAFLDAWNNVQTEFASNNASELNTINEQIAALGSFVRNEEVMLIVSAHLRKGSTDDSTLDDLKGTSNLGYDNLWTGILNNDFIQGIEEPLMYSYPDGREIPMIRIDIPKSKVSAWRFPLMYGLDDSRCCLVPLDPIEYQNYLSTYHQRLINKKKKKF